MLPACVHDRHGSSAEYCRQEANNRTGVSGGEILAVGRDQGTGRDGRRSRNSRWRESRGCSSLLWWSPWARATPRRTSPAAALLITVNCSVGGAGGRGVGENIVDHYELVGVGTLIAIGLTVEVTAQMVTVPSEFARPVILRKPSVAGLRDVG